MKRSSLIAAMVAAATAIPCALAQDDATDQRKQPDAAMPQMPAQMMEYMEACSIAATPGKMHERLAKAAGTWDGRNKMWMMPGMDPIESTCVAVMKPVYDGRYLKAEIEGDMPEMGRFEGFGLYGYDNVSSKFQSVWIDNMSTGIMVGTGQLAADGKSMTWTMTYNCPMTKQPKTMREVERFIDDNTMVMEMYGPDFEGNEYKMMEIRYTRRAEQPAGADAAPASGGATVHSH